MGGGAGGFAPSRTTFAENLDIVCFQISWEHVSFQVLGPYESTSKLEADQISSCSLGGDGGTQVAQGAVASGQGLLDARCPGGTPVPSQRGT